MQDTIKELIGMATCPANEQVVLGALLDTPGADLALELWLGPGFYAYLCDAADEHFGQHDTPDRTTDSGRGGER